MRVYLGLGSNQAREYHLRAGIRALYVQFGELHVSSVYESAAVGFVGEPFYNLVVGLDTRVSVGNLHASLKAIEDRNGRDRRAPRFSARTLDIDILTYGDAVGVLEGVQLPRDEILYHAFVLRPLADIAPTVRHPVLKQTYAELWQQFDQASQPLRRTSLSVNHNPLRVGVCDV